MKRLNEKNTFTITQRLESIIKLAKEIEDKDLSGDIIFMVEEAQYLVDTAKEAIENIAKDYL